MPSPSLKAVNVIDFRAEDELLTMPTSVSSELSNGPWSGEEAATVKAVAAPEPLTAVTVIKSSHPLVSAPTAGHSLKLSGALDAIIAPATIVINIVENFILFLHKSFDLLLGESPNTFRVYR
jgi:hypothetical protein